MAGYPMDGLTAWVAHPLTALGLDHLGTQAPCISLYSRLLPGISNVTDRARYYSLYPWLIWKFDQHFKTASPKDFETFNRRADCLLIKLTKLWPKKFRSNSYADPVVQSLRCPAAHRGGQPDELAQLSEVTL